MPKKWYWSFAYRRCFVKFWIQIELTVIFHPPYFPSANEKGEEFCQIFSADSFHTFLIFNWRLSFVFYFPQNRQAKRTMKNHVGIAVNRHWSHSLAWAKKQICGRQCCRSSHRNLCCGNFSRPSLPQINTHTHSAMTVCLCIPTQ